MKESAKREKSNKFCRFHRDKGHDTEDCFNLKQEIERLIQQGYLREFVTKQRDCQQEERGRDGRNHEQLRGRQEGGRQHGHREDNLPTAGTINVISGGPSCGDSRNARRALLRKAKNTHLIPNGASPSSWAESVFQVQSGGQGLTFGDYDLEGSQREEHNDALVISASLSNFWVRKILVDGGSSADIIFYDVFQQLGIADAQLAPVKTPLIRFTGEVVEALGQITLPLILGTFPRRVTRMVNFLVVKSSLTYNVILGRPSIHQFKAVASTCHMKLRFLTPQVIGEEVGEHRIARECHSNTIQRTMGPLKRHGG
ncbi:PREDICTED: uncharacterized protein LOC105971328 [Erythranthe guttata]|uniref:uncharacterized protein LOC105971328 n=1 Tax=Erythranthe guttata TaxID=4155 RepID=UPI00064DD615|nr:PREDICTED: uncharacterized protein LOC105971328 [Erythranthe guttata]|eukprot:XP_012851629.1 PREDICTED: uncharacterized protein LOC105971328 [Erythranthe guttata]